MENMNITSAQYMADSMTGTNGCIKATIDNQEMSVPLDPANRHSTNNSQPTTEAATATATTSTIHLS
jgi:hypothetical protein